MNEDLVFTLVDGVGTITLNRPEHLNAFTPEMSDRMSQLIHEMEHDPSVRAILFRGEGRAFCAGGDVKAFHALLVEDQRAYAMAMERTVTVGHLAFQRLRRMGKPVVVAAHGATAGLGVSLLCCADLVIAADDCELTLAYRHIGLGLDGGVSYFLPRIVGERRALELSLLGRKLPASRAHDWGLINWVVPAAELRERADKLAAELANGPTQALGAAKQLMRRSLESESAEMFTAEAQYMSVIMNTSDHREGVTAFVEKRPATFTGK